MQSSEHSKQTEKSAVGLLNAPASRRAIRSPIPRCENCGALIIDDSRAANQRADYLLICIVCGHQNEAQSTIVR
jgi:predicted RNA-binding Zn ribbon-like protein